MLSYTKIRGYIKFMYVCMYLVLTVPFGHFMQSQQHGVLNSLLVPGKHSDELAPVVQTLDSAIHRINHYPVDNYYGNQLRYPLDSDLSGG